MLSFHHEVPGWGRLILTQPAQKNKLSVPFLNQAIGVMTDLHANSEGLHVITLESLCDSIFAAGADMNELLGLNAINALDYSQLGQDFMRLVETCPVPVIACVCGPCMGGGFDLVMSCQRIYATSLARFAHPGVFLGIVTGFGGTVRLEERIGRGAARQLLLTGASLNGEKAFEMGLVDRLFSSGKAMRESIKKEYCRDASLH